MTTIIAQRCGAETWIGSDSLATHQTGLKHPLAVQKWKKIGEWRVAPCGPARMLTVLDQYASGSLPVSDFASECQFADFLHQVIEQDRWTPDTRESGAPRRWDANFAIITPDLRVVMLSSTGWLADYGDKFLAIGSGCEWAEGAGHALRQAPPRDRLSGALDAAYALDCYTGGVPYLECLTLAKQDERMVPRQPSAVDRSAGAALWRRHDGLDGAMAGNDYDGYDTPAPLRAAMVNHDKSI